MIINGDSGISVLLPAFRRGANPEWDACFERAVESVLEQKCSMPLELLIIDDGSSDPIGETDCFFKIFRDSRVRLIRLDSNNGLIYALNVGLVNARYSLIGRIDCDDVWWPGKIEKQLLRLESDPDLSIVGTGMRLVYEDPERESEDLIRPGNWSGILGFIREVGCPFPHGSILARKDIFFLLGGYPHASRTFHCEDFALWCIWLRFFKGGMVEEVLYDYSVADRSISASFADQQTLASGKVHQTFLDLPNSLQIPAAMERLAEFLGVGLLEAGKLCFLAWKFFPTIIVEEEILHPMQILLPDRELIFSSNVQNHVGGDFLNFSWGDCSVGEHARIMRNLHNLRAFLH